MINKKNTLFIVFISIFSLLGYGWLINQPFSQQINWFAQNRRVTLILGLIFIKVLGLVWPPLPGGIFNLAIIPFIGWQLAYLTDFIGTVIGAIIDYSIAWKWGNKLLAKIFDKTTVEKINTIKVKKNRQTEFSMVMLISSRFLMTEIGYYAAGLMKVSFCKFMIGAVVTHLLIGIPSYYLTNILIKTNNLYVGIIGLVIIGLFWYKIKDRYFEKNDVK